MELNTQIIETARRLAVGLNLGQGTFELLKMSGFPNLASLLEESSADANQLLTILEAKHVTEVVQNVAIATAPRTYEEQVEAEGVPMTERFNELEALQRYEDGEMTTMEEIILFQKLVDNGHAWALQGSYGRTAMNMLKNGLIKDNPQHPVL